MSSFLNKMKVDPATYLGHDKAMRDDLIVAMLAMLQDLHDGYPWRELGIDMDKLHAHVAELGIEDEVSRGAKWPCEAPATFDATQAQGGGEVCIRCGDKPDSADYTDPLTLRGLIEYVRVAADPHQGAKRWHALNLLKQALPHLKRLEEMTAPTSAPVGV